MVINLLLIGCGYWGKNILRNLLYLPQLYTISIAEVSLEKREELKRSYPALSIFDNEIYALENERFDAAIIATQTPTHFDLAKKLLKSGLHVLVEKPLTTSLSQSKELCKIAEQKDLILMTDHIFRYHPVVKKMKHYFENNLLGKINYIDATRINLGIYQKDVNVVWDLACHDVSIVLYLVQEKPVAVRAIGRKNPEHGTEDIAYLFLYYDSGLLVQINSSWASPVKMRRMIVGAEKLMLIYDDIEPTNKLIVYEYEQNTSFDENKIKLTDYRLGNISIPKIDTSEEALKNVVMEFYNSIATKKQPATNGENAIEVINVLEKAQQSLTLGGAIVPLI